MVLLLVKNNITGVNDSHKVGFLGYKYRSHQKIFIEARLLNP